jgi:hypothetical protein
MGSNNFSQVITTAGEVALTNLTNNAGPLMSSSIKLWEDYTQLLITNNDTTEDNTIEMYTDRMYTKKYIEAVGGFFSQWGNMGTFEGGVYWDGTTKKFLFNSGLGDYSTTNQFSTIYATADEGINIMSSGDDYTKRLFIDVNNFKLISEDINNLNNLEITSIQTKSDKKIITDEGFEGNYLQFNTAATETNAVGKLKWNNTDGTLDLGLKGGNVTLQLGQENVVRVVNKVGANLLEENYQVVRVRTQAEGGAAGQRLAVKLAQADTKANHSGVLGLVTEDINNNQEGFITTFGNINKVNTTGSLQGETWNDGDDLWLSPTVAGGVTNIEPSVHPVKLGYVVYAHAVNGKIFVKVDEGVDQLDELHDVVISAATNGDVLTYNSSTQVWENKTNNSIQKSVGPTYTTNSILTVTQAEYDAIVTKDSTTLYLSETLTTYERSSGTSRY